MALAFRNAELGDVALLLAFMRELYAFDRSPFDEPRARVALEGLLGDASLGRAWLIVDGPEPIGYVVLTLGYSLEFGGRDAFVDELFVRAADRGRGVGAHALRFVEAECRQLGVHALHLEVERANTTAQHVYRKAGFRDHDRYLMTKRV